MPASRRLRFAPAILLAVHCIHPVMADTPGQLKVDMKIDDAYIKKVLGTKIGELYAQQFTMDDAYCRAAAVLVSQEALNNYGYWSTLIDLMKQTAKGIELGGKLGGANTVAKAGQLAFTLMEALEDEEPAAALGRAVLDESTEWLAGKIPKTDNKDADEAIKNEAEAARKQIIEALLPGTKKKLRTYYTTVGDCSVQATPEFQWAGPTKGDVSGMWLHVSGDCNCKKPLRLNGNYSIPTTFHGQVDGIKNCGLGQFQIDAFLPMTKLDTSVSYAGTAINLVDFAKKASKLKKSIQDALNGVKSKDDPEELAKDLQKMTDKATKLSPTLILQPVFASHFEVKDFYAKCGNCPGAGTTPTKPTETFSGGDTTPKTPQEIAERVCSRCDKLLWSWQNAAATVGQDQDFLAKLEKALADAREKLSAEQKQLESLKAAQALADARVKTYQDAATKAGSNPQQQFGQIWTDLLLAQGEARQKVAAQERVVATRAAEVADVQKSVDQAQNRLRQDAQTAAAAKAAYYECLRGCWNQARMGGPGVKVPDDVVQWEKDHPIGPSANTTSPGSGASPRTQSEPVAGGHIDGCLVGTWRSESASISGFQQGGAGIALTIEPDGTEIIDYSKMQPLRSRRGDTNLWSGTATGHIATDKSTTSVRIVDKSNLTLTYTPATGAPRTYTMGGLGPGALLVVTRPIVATPVAPRLLATNSLRSLSRSNATEAPPAKNRVDLQSVSRSVATRPFLRGPTR